ncbi:MAG: hypothetical protein MJK13_18185, partial [Pseudomonadales bacterium]|nr:hypothetical protein [Pseudomonadales bacterium]
RKMINSTQLNKTVAYKSTIYSLDVSSEEVISGAKILMILQANIFQAKNTAVVLKSLGIYNLY